MRSAAEKSMHQNDFNPNKLKNEMYCIGVKSMAYQDFLVSMIPLHKKMRSRSTRSSDRIILVNTLGSFYPIQNISTIFTFNKISVNWGVKKLLLAHFMI